MLITDQSFLILANPTITKTIQEIQFRCSPWEGGLLWQPYSEPRAFVVPLTDHLPVLISVAYDPSQLVLKHLWIITRTDEIESLYAYTSCMCKWRTAATHIPELSCLSQQQRRGVVKNCCHEQRSWAWRTTALCLTLGRSWPWRRRKKGDDGKGSWLPFLVSGEKQKVLFTKQPKGGLPLVWKEYIYRRWTWQKRPWTDYYSYSYCKTQEWRCWYL